MLRQQLARRFLSLACALPRIKSNLWSPTYWKRLGNTPAAARKLHHRRWLAAWPEYSPANLSSGRNYTKTQFPNPKTTLCAFFARLHIHRNILFTFATNVFFTFSSPNGTCKKNGKKTLWAFANSTKSMHQRVT